MKKLLFLVLVFIGAAFLLTNPFTTSTWTLGSSKTEAALTNSIESIKLKTANVNTVIEEYNGKEVKADLQGKGKVNVQRNGKTITVTYKNKPFSFFSFGNSSKLTIYIPKEYSNALELNVGSGDVEFNETSLSLTNFSVKVQSGYTVIQGIDADKLDINVSSGDLVINKVRTKEGSVDLQSGDITIKNYEGKLDSHVSSGDASISINRVVDSIKAHVSSGDMTVTLPPKADITLQAKASTGDINNRFNFKTMKEQEDEIQATNGKGTHRIDVDVSSGDFNLR
ncbi:DUF4097 family beta strand repeat-containing protein [Priestia sp. FSL W8-0001]|uniref:DUF4097 family beta strand repeat-containing protein n=1 Tax=unclassified Priestia TaxID=2800374 RepID=UPI0030FCDADB